MLITDIREVLIEYYRWTGIESPEDISYPHTDPVRHLLGSSVSSIGISDEVAVAVDRALCALKAVSPVQLWILQKLYHENRSISWVAGRKRMDRRTVASMAQAAEHFVYGVLLGAEAIEKPVEQP